MNIKLKNIGILKQADINIDGLTLIAGENDSGKSTVGKVLYSIIKTIRWGSNTSGTNLDDTQKYCDRLNRFIKNLFKSQISQDGSINFYDGVYDFALDIKDDRCEKFTVDDTYTNIEAKLTSPLFIDTPYIWNIIPSLKTMRNLEANGSDIDFEVLETLKDLHFALTTKLKEDDKIKIDISSIINGTFQENHLGDFVFQKNSKNIELVNTAMGIKYFGILQVLSDKNHFYDGQILILDEPEVHLHPKWQIELAKVIVNLVLKGVKVLINSHSPYMIEALQKYTEAQHLQEKTNFYIAQNETIEKIENSNSRTLSEIFEKLSEPFDEFEELERKRS